METYFVQVECDVTAKLHTHPLRYRAYINDELFTERTWIWSNCYLEESFQILAPPGLYVVKFETVDEHNGRIKVRNFRIISGPGRIREYKGQTCVEISNEM
jgi:hypothetical protein